MSAFSTKNIEDGLEDYSEEELARKVEVLVFKGKDLEAEIEDLVKVVAEMETRNVALEMNLHVKV